MKLLVLYDVYIYYTGRKGLSSLKLWLVKYKKPLLFLGLAVAIAAAFSLGRYTGDDAANRKAYAALWEAIPALPDPEQCALCGDGMPYHAPCLMDLSTGQLGEMTVYTEHPSRQGEIAPLTEQQTGTFSLLSCAGLTAIRDTCDHTCQVFLPENRALMNPALFCRKCRQLLAAGGLEGYVILDLHDLEHIRAYPLREEIIRDYRITAERKRDGTTLLCVTGLLGY